MAVTLDPGKPDGALEAGAPCRRATQLEPRLFMKDYGWDIKYALWVISALVVSVPLFLTAPLVLPLLISCVLVVTGAVQLRRYGKLTSWGKVPGILLQTDIGKYRVSVGQYSPPEEHYFLNGNGLQC